MVGAGLMLAGSSVAENGASSVSPCLCVAPLDANCYCFLLHEDNSIYLQFFCGESHLNDKTSGATPAIGCDCSLGPALETNLKLAGSLKTTF